MKPVLTIAALIFSVSTALAGGVCMSSAEMEASLVDWYGETPVAGQEAKDTQLWVSERNGTWSLVQYLPDGNSCVLDSGKDWNSDGDAGELLAMLTD
ncbi:MULTISPECIES: hypothetical protein [Roseobacteraceae]|jgi:hypothetical protein|uniref:S-adenosyl-L-homocysteine hydrolase n=1 Tax=Pseudosulfitobacter pseudonitzschiae TaxID=1402135 RepID=A0A221K4V9_9RHOB|nr:MULTISPECIES: hypothetical protein [Roseobacteraceae]ASM73995.1 S-adenosyl-L-homocysteine hydrolase [Pseudosulfitobacter pseudonitzschiae]